MSFKEYYLYYLSLHQNTVNRFLHFIGNMMTLLLVATIFVLDLSLWWFAATPFVVYPFAWIGHFFFEKNMPAAFTSPVRAKVCDWLMLFDEFRGKLK